MNERVDQLGAVASSICAVHCALFALLPVVFTALGLSFLMGHEAEWVFTSIAILFAMSALVLAWRQHRSIRVIGLFTIGIIGLLVSRGIEMNAEHGDHHDAHATATVESTESHASGDAHKGAAHDEGHTEGELGGHHALEGMGHLVGTVVGVLAGLLLLFGHVLNIRTSRRCREESCS